jgi:hypothetical protein
MSVRGIGVIAGLAPAIHQLKTSSAVVWLDARVGPAHDGCERWQPMQHLTPGEIV